MTTDPAAPPPALDRRTLARAVAELSARDRSLARLAGLAESWRPWRSVAARMLWQHYLAR